MNFFQRPMISLGLSVQSVLESGQSAMETGGAFSEQTGKVDQIGGGLYHIIFKGGIYIALIAVALAGVKLMLSNSATRDEAKRSLFWTGLGVAILAGAVAIVMVLSDIGTGMANDLSS